MNFFKFMPVVLLTAGMVSVSAAETGKCTIYGDFEKGNDGISVFCDSPQIRKLGFRYRILEDHYTRGRVVKVIIPANPKATGKTFRVVIDQPVPPQKTLDSSIVCDVRFSDPSLISRDSIYALYRPKTGRIPNPFMVKFGNFSKTRTGWYRIVCPISKMRLDGKTPFTAKAFNAIRVSFWVRDVNKPLEFWIDNIGLIK